MWVRLISTIWCKTQSGLLSVSFLSSSPFPVFSVSDTAMAVVILRIENGNKKIHEQATKPNDTQHACSTVTLQYTSEMLCQANSSWFWGQGQQAWKRGQKARSWQGFSTSINAGEGQTFWEWAHVWAKENQESCWERGNSGRGPRDTEGALYQLAWEIAVILAASSTWAASNAALFGIIQ